MFIKKVAAVLAATTMMASTTAFAQDITIKLNSEDITSSMPTAPYAKDNRTMVPLRGMFEAVGAKVGWDQETQTAHVAREVDGNLTVIFHQIGTNEAFVNEEKKILDVVSEVKDQYTMVPLRFIMENLGAEVTWDQETYTVNIMTADAVEEVVEEVVEETVEETVDVQ